uniref:C2H2-type domain-containing protein n=1 Tax=Anopheles christyi TaxID=43041 RepID=A0A182JZE8_9DIPT
MDGDVILATACRCCLMEDTDMVYVFDILDEFDMKISELITRNGAIVIQERDAFSKHICGNCLNDLAIAERFVLRCRKTNDLLMNLITSDAQEDTERLIVEDEILANMNHENVSYVLAPPGTEASLHQETPFVEEQTIDSLEQFDDEHTIAQAVDSQQLEDDSLFQLQQQQVEEEELKEETVQYQLDYESDTFNGIDSIIPDDAMALSDGLYAEILEDNSLNQEDEELNRIMDDANKDNGVEEQERASVAGMKMFDFKYSCDRCGASFVTLKHYARHLQSHNILACEKCLEIFKSVEKLKSHEQLCTRDSKNSVEGDTSEPKSLLTIIAPGSTQQKKSLVCSYCNKRWVSQSALTIHLRTHTGERPTQISKSTGINNLSTISAIMVKGENVVTKHLTQLGSNELTVAKLPVPKKDASRNSICNHYKKKDS